MNEYELYDKVESETRHARACEYDRDYRGAEKHYLNCIENLKSLESLDAEKYQPYIYAYYDELCLLAFNRLDDRARAREYEESALKYAKLCMQRNKARYSDDVELFERRLKNDL